MTETEFARWTCSNAPFRGYITELAHGVDVRMLKVAAQASTLMCRNSSIEPCILMPGAWIKKFYTNGIRVPLYDC